MAHKSKDRIKKTLKKEDLPNVARWMIRRVDSDLMALASIFAGVPPERTATNSDINWIAKNLGQEVEKEVKRVFGRVEVLK